jgi:GntR family transcriptional regulator
LADAFNVNKLTVRRAIQELVLQGLIIRRQGRLSRIADPKMRLDPFGSFVTQVERVGLEQVTRVTACRLVRPPALVRSAMRLGERKKALHLSRLRILEGIPVAVEDNWLNENLARPFLDDPASGESLYRSLKRKCGLSRWAVDAEIELSSATVAEASELEIPEGRPLLALRLVLASNGRAFGYTHVRFLAERFHFQLGIHQYSIDPEKGTKPLRRPRTKAR